MLVARVYEWQICEGFRDFCDFVQRQTRGSMHTDYSKNIGLCTRRMLIAQEIVEVGRAEGRHGALWVCRRSVASWSAKSKDLERPKPAALLTFYEVHRVARRGYEGPLLVEGC